MRHHRPGSAACWDMAGSTWTDLVGPDRRAAAQRRRDGQPRPAARPCAASEPAFWVSPEVDREAVEVGYLMLETIAPTGPASCDRTALAVLSALTAISDSYAATEHYEDIFGKYLFGRTVSEWVSAASSDAGWEGDSMRNALRVQYETLRAQRREYGTAAAAEQVRQNHADYREYLRWRDAEGCFYGILLFAAVAAGIDIRGLPAGRVAGALEAGIIAFDTHSLIRHRREDETGDVFRYLPGTHRQQVDAALELVRELHLDLIHATDLDDRGKEFLLRYVTGGTLLPYLPRRWARTTALHIAPIDWPGQGWTHVADRSSHAVGYRATRK
ncbi:MAG: hypothetical protein ACRDN0_00365 [Trebonia sp.]